ncbi:hypothetical protein H5T87_03985 [bacterium]|nr:hypothetical protein [bacterium]
MTFSTHLSGLDTALIGASPRLARKQDFGLGSWPMRILGFTSATSGKGKWRLSFKMKVIAPPILSIFPYLYHTNRIGMNASLSGGPLVGQDLLMPLVAQ